MIKYFMFNVIVFLSFSLLAMGAEPVVIQEDLIATELLWTGATSLPQRPEDFLSWCQKHADQEERIESMDDLISFYEGKAHNVLSTFNPDFPGKFLPPNWSQELILPYLQEYKKKKSPEWLCQISEVDAHKLCSIYYLFSAAQYKDVLKVIQVNNLVDTTTSLLDEERFWHSVFYAHKVPFKKIFVQQDHHLFGMLQWIWHTAEGHMIQTCFSELHEGLARLSEHGTVFQKGFGVTLQHDTVHESYVYFMDEVLKSHYASSFQQLAEVAVQFIAQQAGNVHTLMSSVIITFFSLHELILLQESLEYYLKKQSFAQTIQDRTQQKLEKVLRNKDLNVERYGYQQESWWKDHGKPMLNAWKKSIEDNI